MGYMGLNSSGESDNAADFVFIYKKAKTKTQRRQLIDSELKDFANNYNTPGSVNIALAMEDGIVRGDDLTAKQLNRLRELLADLKLKSSSKYREEWDDEYGRLEHNQAYTRMLRFIAS